jgi:hypothetical protein
MWIKAAAQALSEHVDPFLQGHSTLVADISSGDAHLVDPRAKPVMNCLGKGNHSAGRIEQQSTTLIGQSRIPIIKAVNPNPDAIDLEPVNSPTKLPRLFLKPCEGTRLRAEHGYRGVDQFQITTMPSIHTVCDSRDADCEPAMQPIVPFTELELDANRTLSAARLVIVPPSAISLLAASSNVNAAQRLGEDGVGSRHF